MKLIRMVLIFLVPAVFALVSCNRENGAMVVSSHALDEGSMEPDSSTGLFAHWSFLDDSETQLIDSSDYSLNGVIHGATRTIEDGHLALKFDGDVRIYADALTSKQVKELYEEVQGK